LRQYEEVDGDEPAGVWSTRIVCRKGASPLFSGGLQSVFHPCTLIDDQPATLRTGGPIMSETFPEPIRRLPSADVPLEGVTAYLSQSETHQIVFMEFDEDVELPEHAHEAQWGLVLEGRIELDVAGSKQVYGKGDRYFIPKGVEHSAKVSAGYADVTFFDEPSRFRAGQDS
jgi:quercetin dioxygenase-like cupin family protein